MFSSFVYCVRCNEMIGKVVAQVVFVAVVIEGELLTQSQLLFSDQFHSCDTMEQEKERQRIQEERKKSRGNTNGSQSDFFLSLYRRRFFSLFNCILFFSLLFFVTERQCYEGDAVAYVMLSCKCIVD